MDIVEYPIAHLHDAPHQPRTDPGDLDALAESIRELGLLQPVVVRSLGSTDCEIVAGHRRVAAARSLGWETIPCRVLTLNDAEALAATIAENLQREGISPLEEAAAVARLRDTGAPIARIAASLGKPERWVRQRAQIAALSQEWRDALSNPHHDAHGCPPDLLAVVARLPVDIQDKVLGHAAPNYGGEWDTAGTFAAWIAEQFLHELTAAPFDVNAADLPGGSCQLCPKRSACQAELWDDVGNRGELGSCLDAACWSAKVVAHVRAEFAARQAKLPNLLLARDRTDRGGSLPEDLATEALSLGSLEVVPKKTPGARPALIANGAKAGQVVYVKPQNWADKDTQKAFAASAASEESPVDPEQAKQARRDRVETKRNRWLVQRVCEHLTVRMTGALPETVQMGDLLTWAVVWGVRFEARPAETIGAVREAAWNDILGEMIGAMRTNVASSPAQAVLEAEGAMKDLGDDLQFRMFQDQSRVEIPMPKGLG